MQLLLMEEESLSKGETGQTSWIVTGLKIEKTQYVCGDLKCHEVPYGFSFKQNGSLVAHSVSWKISYYPSKT